MPPAQRRAAAGVIEELLQNPQQFGFFQAIRLLEGWLAEGGQSGQGLSRLNFRNSLSLSFPPSEIESLVVQRHGEPTDSNRAGSAAASGDAAALALDAVLAAYLTEFARITRVFTSAAGNVRSSGLLDQVTELCNTIGKSVRVELPSGESPVGTAIGLSENGSLIVEMSNCAEPLVVSAGDVTHLRVI